MSKLVINNTHIADLPRKWQELNRKQIKAVCRLIPYAQSDQALSIMLLCYFTGLSLKTLDIPQDFSFGSDELLHRLYHKKTGHFLANTADINQMISALDFMFAYTDKRKTLAPKFIINHFPVLRNRYCKSLHGPGAGLSTITFKEFIRLESLLERIDTDTVSENLFYAVLYRPRDKTVKPSSRDFNGDFRIPFNDYQLHKLSTHTAKLHRWQKTYIRLFYQGCRDFLSRKFDKAFAATDKVDDTPKTTFEKLNDLVVQLANKDLTKISTIRDSMLYDVLSQLNHIVIEGRKARELSDKKPIY